MDLKYGTVKQSPAPKTAISMPSSPQIVPLSVPRTPPSDERNRSKSLPAESLPPVTPIARHNTPPQDDMPLNFAPKPVIITPPYSSTSDKPLQHPFSSELSPEARAGPERPRLNSNKRRSFGSRRRRVPKALDMDALNRERQFTGPYSANPLLRSHRASVGETDSLTSGPSGPGTPSTADSARARAPQLPHLTPREPPSKPVTLPLISEMVTAAYISPSRAGAPVSLVSPLSVTSPWAAEKPRLGLPLLEPLREPPFAGAAEPSGTPSKRARLDTKWVNSAKRERFLKLCGEAFDLLLDE